MDGLHGLVGPRTRSWPSSPEVFTWTRTEQPNSAARWRIPDRRRASFKRVHGVEEIGQGHQPDVAFRL